MNGDKLGLAGQTYGVGATDTDDIVFEIKCGILHNKTLNTRVVYSPSFIHPDINAVWRFSR